ncbi:MAG: rhomboid family intramembrane serine protease [Bdellovibrionota bacterium]
MIFPYLSGLLAFSKAPFTYFLVFLNILVFFATYPEFVKSDRELDRLLENDTFIETQGAAFAAMIAREPAQFSPILVQLGQNAMKPDFEARQMLGTLALRNPHFMERANDYIFGGDQVALKMWNEKFNELKALQERHPSYRWGVSRSKNTGLQWISYQFAHSGWSHLFWNTLFLAIFGCFIEIMLGSSFVALAYVGGGLFGALFYSMLSGISSSPLSLIGFSYWKKKEVKFFFWLLPMRGYYGFILLPGWLLLLVSLVPDVSGYIASSHEFGSVAYSAHLGGAVFGALIAGGLHLGWLKFENVDEDEEDLEKQKRSKRRDDADSNRKAS